MAQLDQLIEAMLQHSAEALVLQRDHKPCLLMGGAERPIVKTALAADHVSRLAAEIAPGEQSAAIAGGGTGSFAYVVNGSTVQVEITAGPKAVIRPGPPVTEQPAAASPSVATTEPAEAPAAEPVPVTPIPISAAPAPDGEGSQYVDPAMVEAPPTGDELSMDWMLRQLVERGGSDLHLSSGSKPMIRIDGGMGTFDEVAVLEAARAEQLLLSITPERNREEFRKTGDTDFAYEIEGLCRFRSNLFKDRKGAGGVFRVIPSKILTADDLGLSRAVKNLCFLTKGLVLVTGPKIGRAHV